MTESGPGADVSFVARNCAQVRSAIRQACLDAGRGEDEVRLLPVSKTHPAELVEAAMGAGCTSFGENRVQEMAAKAEQVPAARWVLIGHLQRNKVGLACSVMNELQSLDSLGLALALQRRLDLVGGEDRLRVLVEVNTSGESTKTGIAPDQVMDFTHALGAYPHLDPVGLMTVAHPDPVLAAQGFSLLSDLRSRLRDRDGQGWAELSMGMSGDFRSAIAHGSTCVRIGTAIFGQRA